MTSVDEIFLAMDLSNSKSSQHVRHDKRQSGEHNSRNTNDSTLQTN